MVSPLPHLQGTITPARCMRMAGWLARCFVRGLSIMFNLKPVASRRARAAGLPTPLLLGLVVLATLAPFLAAGVFAVARFAAEHRAAERDQLTELAKSLSNAVDRELYGYLETARVVAASPQLERGDLEGFAELARVAASRTGGHFQLIDRNSRHIVNTLIPVGTVRPLAAEPEEVNRVFDTGEYLVGHLVEMPITHQLQFGVRVPVSIGNELRYVLTFIPPQGVIQKLVQQTFKPSGWFAGVIDNRGLVAARSASFDKFFGRPISPEFARQLSEQRSTLESTDLEGRPVVTAYEKSLISDWRVLVWAPQETLAQAGNRALIVILQCFS